MFCQQCTSWIVPCNLFPHLARHSVTIIDRFLPPTPIHMTDRTKGCQVFDTRHEILGDKVKRIHHPPFVHPHTTITPLPVKGVSMVEITRYTMTSQSLRRMGEVLVLNMVYPYTFQCLSILVIALTWTNSLPLVKVRMWDTLILLIVIHLVNGGKVSQKSEKRRAISVDSTTNSEVRKLKIPRAPIACNSCRSM